MTQEHVLEILKAVSHPTRIEILRRIKAKQGEVGAPCSSILEGMEISQSTFSHHISELSRAGVITGNPQGRCMLICVNDEVWAEFQQNLSSAIFS